MALITVLDLVMSSAIFVVASLITVVVYRLYFSPLAEFPGPRLAALTLWYEFYYDVVKRGRYTWKIMEMHAQYGELDANGAQCSIR